MGDSVEVGLGVREWPERLGLKVPDREGLRVVGDCENREGLTEGVRLPLVLWLLLRLPDGDRDCEADPTPVAVGLALREKVGVSRLVGESVELRVLVGGVQDGVT